MAGDPTSLMTRPPVFLRRALLIDVVGTGAVAVALTSAAEALAPLFALDVMLLRGAGVFLLAYAAVVLFIATRAQIARGAAWAVVLANDAWATASILALVLPLLTPSLLGQLFIGAQAMAVFGFAALQIIGLTRAKNA